MNRKDLKANVEYLSSISDEARTLKMNYAICKTENAYRPFAKAWEDELLIHQANFLKKEKMKQEDLEAIYKKWQEAKSKLEASNKRELQLSESEVILMNKEERILREKFTDIDSRLDQYLEKCKEWQAFISEDIPFSFHAITFDEAFFDENLQMILNPKTIHPTIYDLIICD